MTSPSVALIPLILFDNDKLSKAIYGKDDYKTDPFYKQLKAPPRHSKYLECSAPEVSNGKDLVFSIKRHSDYLTNVTLIIHVPEVSLKKYSLKDLWRLRWTRNLAHNLVQSIQMVANDMVIWKFDSLSLDQINMFSDRSEAYYKTIGNIDELINPTKIHPARGRLLPKHVIHLPMDFTSTQGFIIPLVAIPYATVEIRVTLGDWSQLLILDDFGTGKSRPACISDLLTEPVFRVESACEYAMVTNQQRQISCKQAYNIVYDHATTCSQVCAKDSSTIDYNLKLSTAHRLVHAFYYGFRNITNPAEKSNYAACSPVLHINQQGRTIWPAGVEFEPELAGMEEICFEAYHELSDLLIPDLADIVLSYMDPITVASPMNRDPVEEAHLFYAPGQGATLDGKLPKDSLLLRIQPTAIGCHLYRPAAYSHGELATGLVCGGEMEMRLTLKDSALSSDQQFEAFAIQRDYRLCYAMEGMLGPRFTY